MKISNVISKSTLLRIILSLFLVIPMSAHAAIYMFIEGVKGDVTIKGYEEWIDVSSVQEGMSQVVDLGGATGGGAGKVNIADTTIAKALDMTSPVLRQKITEGKSIPSVIISMVATGSADINEYFRIDLTNVYLTSISMSASGEEVPLESMSVTFEAVQWTYIPIKSDGTSGSPITAGWDIVSGKGI